MGGNGIPYGTMLRGYPDNSIGPLTAQGRGIGGNTIMKYSSEFRFPFSENPVVYGMLFAEAGGVWNDTRLIQSLGFPRKEPLELKRSAGIGIRFFMPMIGNDKFLNLFAESKSSLILFSRLSRLFLIFGR
jgi:outer membrane protein insertion porin family